METELKKIRLKKFLKQTEVAKQAKISIRSYQSYETGEHIPNVYTAQLIAKALGIEDVKEIFPLSEYC